MSVHGEAIRHALDRLLPYGRLGDADEGYAALAALEREHAETRAALRETVPYVEWVAVNPDVDPVDQMTARAVLARVQPAEEPA